MPREHRPEDSRAGRWIRRLPLLPLIAFTSLSLFFGALYDSTLASSQACFTPGMGIVCRSASPLLLLLSAIWAASAAAVAVLMGVQAVLARRDRSLGTPSWLLLAFGAIVTILGALWLGTPSSTNSGGTFASSELGLRFAYVTASLLLFAATFVDFDPDRLPDRRWAAALAIGNAGLALTAGLLRPI